MVCRSVWNDGEILYTWKVTGIRKRKLFRTLSLFASPHQTISFSLYSHIFFVWIWEFSVNTYYLLLLPTFTIVNIYLLCWCTIFWLLVWFWATHSIKYMVEYKQNLKTEDKDRQLFWQHIFRVQKFSFWFVCSHCPYL